MARLRFATIASESAPPAGQVSVYAKTDNNLYMQTSAGNEYLIFNSGIPGVGGYNVEQFQIDLSELTAKEVILSSTPTHPTRTLLSVDGGAGLGFYGLDFTVSGNVLSWSGTSLDGLLELNDLIQVIYF